MIDRHIRENRDGFTIIEVLVAITLLALALLSLGSLVTTLQTAKRNNDALTNATLATRTQIENIRTGYISALYGYQVNICGFNQDLTGSLSSSNLTNARGSATISCVDGVYGVRKLDVNIYYDVGSTTKFLHTTTYIGNSGLY